MSTFTNSAVIEHKKEGKTVAKAKFIRKYYGVGYERNFVFMDYEYRGHGYTVYENLCKGNEPLAWQHKNHQSAIDNEIERETKQKQTGEPFDLDEVWKILGWD